VFPSPTFSILFCGSTGSPLRKSSNDGPFVRRSLSGLEEGEEEVALSGLEEEEEVAVARHRTERCFRKSHSTIDGLDSTRTQHRKKGNSSLTCLSCEDPERIIESSSRDYSLKVGQNIRNVAPSPLSHVTFTSLSMYRYLQMRSIPAFPYISAPISEPTQRLQVNRFFGSMRLLISSSRA
jgi:hypothetical protein